jgi:DNA-binding protein H-NS
MRCSSLQADIELLQKVLEKGERVLTLKEQRGISQYEEVVAQFELTKDFFETFDKEKLQTFSKTEGDVETTMMKY